MFKKILMFMGFLCLSFGLLFGASATANVTITGTVQGLLSLESSGNLVIDLDPSVDAEQSSNTITTTERSNNKTGYDISIGSSNGWVLSDGAATPEEIPYYFTYDGTKNTNPSGAIDVVDTTEKTTGQGIDRDLTIHVDLDPTVTLVSSGVGSYTDTITFTITTK